MSVAIGATEARSSRLRHNNGFIGPQTIEILEDGSFRPTIYAIKKDGTKSTRYVYTPYEVQSVITKID